MIAAQARHGRRMSGEIEFSIRESRRARHLSLRARPPRTVELVVPRGLRPEIIAAFVRRHRDWIDRAGRALIRNCPDTELRPSAIDLNATGETVRLRYQPGTGRRGLYAREGDVLTLHCRHSDLRDHPVLLRRWLLDEGSRVLKPWLARESSRVGLVPRRVQVRLQATRWGSCSANGTISLNAALLLVKPALVRYLFVHELAHLEHLSHSDRYWRTVARHEPGYEMLDRELSRSWRQLPAWLLNLRGNARC
jgi:predicted metal-dependent hydrolase